MKFYIYLKNLVKKSWLLKGPYVRKVTILVFLGPVWPWPTSGIYTENFSVVLYNENSWSEFTYEKSLIVELRKFRVSCVKIFMASSSSDRLRGSVVLLRN